MQTLEMIPCPKCGNDFPLKRKELGYHVCVNCSTTKPVVGITTVEGTGDHTYNDIIIMDQDRARAIAAREAEIGGRKLLLDYDDIDLNSDDTFDSDVTQSMKEAVSKALDDEEEVESFDPNKPAKKIKGIDY